MRQTAQPTTMVCCKPHVAGNWVSQTNLNQIDKRELVIYDKRRFNKIRMILRSFLPLALTLTFVLSYGQSKLITGRVVDSETKKPISDSKVSREDTIVITNSLGFFQLRTNTGDTITITHHAYGTKMVLVPDIERFSIEIDKNSEPDKVYKKDEVDQAPEPELGIDKFYLKWATTAEYPRNARRLGFEGTVKIFFVVDENGAISESGIIEGFNRECNEAALESFRKLALKWKPGIKDGKKVKVIMIEPFKFKLG